MLSSAIALAERGLAIFPCRVRDKRPATENGCKGATRDLDQIRDWWKVDPNFNIGIATGAPSGVFVVDIDSDNGERALVKLGVLSDTVESTTARGRHVYFRMPTTIAIGNSAGKIAGHVDVRGTGGYVLAPPSIHPSGKRYAWSADCTASVADAPQWLIDRLKPKPRPHCIGTKRFPCRGVEHLSGPICTVMSAPEGQRNAILYWAACRAGEAIRDGAIDENLITEILVAAAARCGLEQREGGTDNPLGVSAGV